MIAPRIVWTQIAGADRYRLQIATDYEFQDVLLDRLVYSREYQPTGLAPGTYFWRVAPAQFGTGTFVKPALIRVRAVEIAPIAHRPKPVRELPGWWAGTGKVGSIALIEDRNGFVGDVVVVNASQTVYLLDGNTGVARWVAPFGSFALADHVFAPIHLRAQGQSLVVVAFEHGVRALSLATGKEIWRLELARKPFAGEVLESGAENPALFLIDDRRDGLLVIDGLTGTVRRKLTLSARANSPPVRIPNRGLLLQLKRELKLLNAHGDEIDSLSLTADPTTHAIVTESSLGTVLLVGTRAGLDAYRVGNFQPLGRLSLQNGEYPLGDLVLADLNGDRLNEIVMQTSQNRITAVDVGKGALAWSIDPKSGPNSIAAIDLDRDGKEEILLIGRDHRLVAFSGEGTEIWQSELTLGVSPARVAAGKTRNGRQFVIATDASGVRTLEVAPAARPRGQEIR